MSDQIVRMSEPNGRIHDVSMQFIEHPAGRVYDDSTNCVLITAKEEGGRFVVINKAPIRGYQTTVANYFGSWSLDPHEDGMHRHRDRQLGATHYGVVFSEYPDLVDHLARVLEPMKE